MSTYPWHSFRWGRGNKTVTDNSLKAKNPAAHLECRPYGVPSKYQYSCPKCENYRSLNARDLSGRFYRELQEIPLFFMQRRLLQSEGGAESRFEAAHIRETNSNRDLEGSIEKIVESKYREFHRHPFIFIVFLLNSLTLITIYFIYF